MLTHKLKDYEDLFHFFVILSVENAQLHGSALAVIFSYKIQITEGVILQKEKKVQGSIMNGHTSIRAIPAEGPCSASSIQPSGDSETGSTEGCLLSA